MFRLPVCLFLFALTARPATLDVSQLRAEDVKKGVAVLGVGPDFLWAFDSDKRPTLYIDGQPAPAMKRARAGAPWTYTGKLKTGTSHSFYYMVEGKKVGGLTDVPAFEPDSYAQPGVPQGKLSEKRSFTSKLYEGMTSDYWVYVPAGIRSRDSRRADDLAGRPLSHRARRPAQVPISGQPPSRLQNVIDNLTYQKKIPVAIYLLIDPGTIGTRAMRSIQYDTVSDLYPRFLRDEVLPRDLQQIQHPQRRLQPRHSGQLFGRNLRLQCRLVYAGPLQPRGCAHPQLYGAAVEAGPAGWRQYLPFPRPQGRQAQHPRLDAGWLGRHGSREAAAGRCRISQMANSLKFKGYDFHFSFGTGTHNHAQNNSEMPEVLTWLWRDYDPAKTQQTFEQDAAEKAKPFFRVKVYNRD